MNIQDVISDFQIVGYRIKQLSLTNDFVFFDPESENVTREIDVQYEISDPYYYEDDENAIGGTVVLYIDVNVFDDEEKIAINLELEGGFCQNDNKDIELFKNMLEINGCASLYSIGRGIVTSVTSQMCVNGTVTIPMINTFKLKEKRDTEDEA